MPAPNARLADALSDRYEIEREVGAGGMATVYLARDKKHDRKVALKVLRPELVAGMGAERFPREIKLIAQFNHPHILSLYDSGEAQGFLYYVMPYVDGESLRDRLTREKQLPVSDVIRIVREVADALAYSHTRGVVHRDIKPGNVLLSGRHAIVTDFGVAKALSAGGDNATTVGIAVGTPTYMAPEQAMGERDIDGRADIYALGTLAYEMLAGGPPFEGKTAQATLTAHVMEMPTDIQAMRPGISPLLGDAIMRCLAKNPADRWQTADELIARLEQIASTPSGGMTPTDTRPVKAVAGGKKAAPSRRNVMLAVVGVIVALAAVAGRDMIRGFRDGFATASGPGEKIGVMPIEDISGKDSVFVNAMHAELTSKLSQMGGIGVVSRNEMMRYKGSAKTTREIAKEVNVGAVIEATVFRAGDVMRINVQLTDPATSHSLWSDTYEQNVSNVLEAQSAVAEKITAGVKAAFTGQKKNGENK